MESLFENETKMISEKDYNEWLNQICVKNDKTIKGTNIIIGIIELAIAVHFFMKGIIIMGFMVFLIAMYCLIYKGLCYKGKPPKSQYNAAADKIGADYCCKNSFYNDSFVVKSDKAELKFKYSDIKYVIETENCVIFTIKRSMLWIDKNGFTKGSLEEFVSFLRGKRLKI